MKMEILTICLLSGKQSQQAVPSFCLLSIEKSSGSLLINGIKQALTRRAIFLLHPGTSFSVEMVNADETCGCMLLFDLYEEKSRTAEKLVYEKVQTFSAEGLISYHRPAIGRLLSSIHHADDDPPYMREGAAAELLHWLSDQPSSLRLEDNEERIHQTLSYMSTVFTEPITLSGLAERAGMTPAYYSHLFKQKMNKTPMEWLTHLRLNTAKELLLAGDIKVKESALRTGYQDEHYFSRRFKQTFGIAPSHYNRKHIKKVISLSYPYTDHLLALGVTPAAGQLQESFDSRIKELTLPYHASEPWDIQRQFFLEQRPDLILCKNNIASMAKEHIGDIAPVISIDWTSMDVYSHADTIAHLLGKEAAFSAWHSVHNEKVQKARAEVENRIGIGRSAAIWSVTNKGVRLYGARNMGHVFYRLLGFRAPGYVQEKIEEYPVGTMFTWMPASLEQMKRDRSDFMWIVTDSEHRRKMIKHEIKTDPLLSAHPAVQNGRCFFLDWQKWIVYAPLGIEKQLEEAVLCLRSYESRSNPLSKGVLD